MGKRQMKKTAGWSRLMVGVLLSAGVYFAGIFLLSLLMVRGTLSPEKGDVLLWVWALLSAACGSLVTMKIPTVSPVLACLMQGGSLVALIFAASYLFWEGPVWRNSNAVLLLCVLLGALAPGMMVRGKGKRKRKRGW